MWQWLTDSGVLHAIVVPPPAEVWDRLLAIIPEPYFHKHLWVTVKEVLIGFGIGASSGIITALIAIRYPLFRRAMTPYIVSLQALPKIVLLPLLYVWFGVGSTSATIIVILVSFFPVYVNTLTGMAIVDEQRPAAPALARRHAPPGLPDVPHPLGPAPRVHGAQDGGQLRRDGGHRGRAPRAPGTGWAS